MMTGGLGHGTATWERDDMRTPVDLALMALAAPVMLLNLLGGAVAGVWLLAIGEWRELVAGILIIVVSGMALAWALLPSLLLAVPAAAFMQRGNKPGTIVFGFLSWLYVEALITAWCVAILFVFYRRADPASLVPMLLWSYVVATAPWFWMAQKERDNEFSILTVFVAQLAYVVTMCMLLFAKPTMVQVVVTFSAIVAVGGLFQLWMAMAMDREQKKLSAMMSAYSEPVEEEDEEESEEEE